MDTKKGQLITLVVFGVFIFIGLAAIVTQRGRSNGEQPLVPVTVWGTFDAGTLRSLIAESGMDPKLVIYTEFREEEFDQEFIEALARGEGPDALLLPHQRLLRHKDKLVPVPYDAFPERQYKNTFVEGSELYLSPAGIWAIPFSVDPIVMYWNRDIFTKVGRINPPEYWDEFPELVEDITLKENTFTITRASAALGEYRNITHAKELLSLLFIKSGNPLLSIDQEGNYGSLLLRNLGYQEKPALSALRFYTQFANPSRSTYTWNRSLPESREAFLSGDLALYFGYASEIEGLERANPNLNFEMAPIPQVREADFSKTYGEFLGFSFLKRSQNIAQAYLTFVELSAVSAANLYDASNVVPVRKSELAVNQVTAEKDIAYESAIITRAWLDPEPEETDDIFQDMVENILANRSTLVSALEGAQGRLSIVLEEINSQ